MPVMHLEFLVEELSMEAFLRELLPRLLPEDVSFEVYPSQGKQDLLGNLRSRLRAYAAWLTEEYRVIVVVDRDSDVCVNLKSTLEADALAAGLVSRSSAGGGQWQVVNRIAIEELEAWYFGEWSAVCTAFARVTSKSVQLRKYSNPDAIAGGTWEAFERVLQTFGYFKTGLRKVEAAREIGATIDPQKSTSHSFIVFRDAVQEAVR